MNTVEKGKQTPTPWKWDGKVWDYDREQEAPWLVADAEHTNPPILTGEIRCQSQADAEFIVRAVNAHEALVEALKASLPSRCQAEYFSSPDYKGGAPCGRCSYCKGSAALALAKHD